GKMMMVSFRSWGIISLTIAYIWQLYTLVQSLRRVRRSNIRGVTSEFSDGGLRFSSGFMAGEGDDGKGEGDVGDGGVYGGCHGGPKCLGSCLLDSQ
ncbi:hypothetical protein M8C21_002903, partial [Ambrosia artemisiifolia]